MDRGALPRFLPALLPVIFTFAALAQAPHDFHPPLAILHCERSQGVVTEERARLALWYAADEMRLAVDHLPRILVVHGSPESARIMALPVERGEAGGVAIYGAEDGQRVYYLWIVSQDTDRWLARGMVNILARHLGLDQNAQGDHVRRVHHRMTATITTNALRQRAAGPSE